MWRAIVCLILVGVVAAAPGQYEEVLARYKIWPMASAAFSDHPELCVKDNYNVSEFHRRIAVTCDLVPTDQCVVFSAVSHSDKAIIFAFRGSHGAEVAMEVIESILTKPVTPFAAGGHVNEYFNNAFLLLWDSGLKDDLFTLKNANPNYDVWLTGHSLGAAVASLAAVTIAELKYVEATRIKLYTYGQPRVGNAEYAATVDRLVPNAFRIVHKNDIVPHLPPEFFEKYHHHKSEVWYDNNMAVGASYVLCQEDEGKTCSDSQIDLVPSDHDDYWNISTGFADKGCPGWNPYH